MRYRIEDVDWRMVAASIVVGIVPTVFAAVLLTLALPSLAPALLVLLLLALSYSLEAQGTIEGKIGVGMFWVSVEAVLAPLVLPVRILVRSGAAAVWATTISQTPGELAINLLTTALAIAVAAIAFSYSGEFIREKGFTTRFPRAERGGLGRP